MENQEEKISGKIEIKQSLPREIRGKLKHTR